MPSKYLGTPVVHLGVDIGMIVWESMSSAQNVRGILRPNVPALQAGAIVFAQTPCRFDGRTPRALENSM